MLVQDRGDKGWIARKLRIEYEGALYHVLNRGNYRRDVFESTVPRRQAEQNVNQIACELKEARWQRCLVRIMKEAKRTQPDAMATAKSASWKIALATRLRREEGASVCWIAQTLYMGKPGAVRVSLSRDAARKGN